jgi:DNA-directed RNA polymerase subunit N (RpoN/RPB10)
MYTYLLSFSINKDELLSTMVFMILGIVLASAYTVFIKKYRGEFVLALIESAAFDEESAKSLDDLGINKGLFRRMAKNTKFFFSPDYYIIDGDPIKYYVNKDSVSKLEAKYGNTGITFVQLLITIIAFFSVALILATVVPDLLNMFKFQ